MMLQLLDPNGKLTSDDTAGLGLEDLRRLYWEMLRLRVLDGRLLELQRAGRIGFYGPVAGEEAAVVGSAYALEAEDWVFPALRQGGILLLRGFPLRRYLSQLLGNAEDVSRGRQMPCHFSSRDYRVVSWSSCIGTQLPHAVGAAYAARLRGDPAVMAAYLGDGAASAPDFHAALNFAGVYKVPAVFICQNNGWAISVPASRQTASAGIAVKAAAYGMPGVRADGNDVLAVHRVVGEAVARARTGGGPTLVETVTYRMGVHSSSDDPARYRDPAEVKAWESRDPLLRLRRHLAARGEWSETWERKERESLERALAAALAEAEKISPPAPESLVKDVYAETLPAQQEQVSEVMSHVQRGEELGKFPL